MPTHLVVIRTVADLRERVRAWRSEGQRIALVPTMGALHAGHLSLVELARLQADRVIVSIFVNPAQFAADEDLARYPQTFTQDCEMLEQQHVDVVYAPDAGEMYPEGFATAVDPAGPAKAGLEDAFRPHFFKGVATVVAKLFTQSGADLAVFGEKDYQQLLVVRRVAQDLDLPIRIVSAPTLRESDGLAMSSRNRYLSREQRSTAATLAGALGEIASELRSDPRQVAPALDRGRKRLAEAGLSVDYLELRDAETLARLATAVPDARILVAAHLGSTRLIDNLAIARQPNLV